MRRKVLIILLAAAVSAALAGIQALTQQQPPPQLKINKVKDDLYEIEGDGGNVAVLVSNEGVLLVDDKYDQDHDQIVTLVKGVTNQPIKYVINTHYHADHSGGNTRFLLKSFQIRHSGQLTNLDG